MPGLLKNILVWFGIVLIIMAVMDGFSGNHNSGQLAFSDFLAAVDAGQINQVNIRGNVIEGTYSDGSNFSTYSPGYDGLTDRLVDNGVRINATPTESTFGSFLGILLGWFPIFLLIGVWIYMMRGMQGGGKGGAMGFGKSRARMLSDKENQKTFADVAGIDEAKEELEEIVDFLSEPDKFQKLGGKIPKGVLLAGSPGTGKTLLAKAIAGEAGVPFFTISGSDFVEMFVGVGASRVRDMFEQARKNAPCIVFIDEIDAVGRHRGTGMGGGNDEREQTLNQLLVEMDGFEGHEGVIVIAATNRPDVLDPALLRPGRFDRQITVPNPDIRGREHILQIHTAPVPIGPDVDLKIIARGTPGFSGADLANLVNESALMAARRNKKIVTMSELEDAKDKVMMGAERRSMIMDDEEKKLTAYHEAGHALVGLSLPACDPIHKATIIPRGRALGMVMRLPEKDQLSVTRIKLESDIAMALGGRVAEELIFGHDRVTSGASSDLKYATSMARNMVEKWGMSNKVGVVYHGSENDEPFLGYNMQQRGGSSEETANLIDQEVKELLETGYEKATTILKKRSKDLKLIAEAMLEHETLTGDDINNLLAGKGIDKTPPPSAGVKRKGSSLPGKKKASKKTSNDVVGGEPQPA